MANTILNNRQWDDYIRQCLQILYGDRILRTPTYLITIMKHQVAPRSELRHITVIQDSHHKYNIDKILSDCEVTQ